MRTALAALAILLVLTGCTATVSGAPRSNEVSTDSNDADSSAYDTDLTAQDLINDPAILEMTLRQAWNEQSASDRDLVCGGWFGHRQEFTNVFVDGLDYDLDADAVAQVQAFFDDECAGS